MLGWNDGTEQEIFTMEELIEKFSIDRVHKAGAKFDFEKAKWFNHEWIKKVPGSRLSLLVKEIYRQSGTDIKDEVYFSKVIELVKDRCTLVTDFFEQSVYFFKSPDHLDEAAVKPKWNVDKTAFFIEFCNKLNGITNWELVNIENEFKNLAAEKNIKPGELQLPMRIMLVGGKYGPAVFEIAALIGKEETISRIKKALTIFEK